MIKSEDLNLFVGENVMKHGFIFLECGQKPSSKKVNSLPVYYLLMTNKRLFFFNYGIYGSITSRTGIKIAGKVVSLPIDIVASGLSGATFGISQFVGLAAKKFFESRTDEPEIDVSNFIDNEESFIVSLLQIVDCELCISVLSSRVTYIRLQLLRLSGPTHLDSLQSLCISSVNPLALDQNLDYRGLFNQIELSRKNALAMVEGKPNATAYFESWSEGSVRYITFKSSSLGITFEHPKNWIKEESVVVVLFTNTPKKVRGLNGPSFDIHVVNPGEDPIFPTSDLSLDDVVNHEVKYLMSNKDCFSTVTITEITINGIKGRMIEYSDSEKILNQK